MTASKDFWAGLMFVGFGLVFAVTSQQYSIGTAGRMGPGYFPVLLGLVLIAIGAIIALRPIVAEREPVPRIHVVPLAIMVAAISLFGLFIEPLGLVVSVAVLVVLVARSGDEFRWREVAILALALVVFSVAIFVYALGLQLSVWPSL
jgi:hypothetical protein